jgi:hypothetical protein
MYRRLYVPHKGQCGCGNPEHASNHVHEGHISMPLGKCDHTEIAGGRSGGKLEFSFVMVQTGHLMNRFRDFILM